MSHILNIHEGAPRHVEPNQAQPGAAPLREHSISAAASPPTCETAALSMLSRSRSLVVSANWNSTAYFLVRGKPGALERQTSLARAHADAHGASRLGEPLRRAHWHVDCCVSADETAINLCDCSDSSERNVPFLFRGYCFLFCLRFPHHLTLLYLSLVLRVRHLATSRLVSTQTYPPVNSVVYLLNG